MRVTNKMLTQSFISNMNTNLARLDKVHNQLTSTRRLNKPSDDPIAVARLLNTKSALKAQDQYKRNMEDAVGWLDIADDALEFANGALQRARTLVLTGSTATIPQASMVALAGEVDNLVGEMLQIANTSHAGRYVFGGGKTAVAPFVITSNDGSRITAVEFVKTDFGGLASEDVSAQLNKIYSQEVEIESGVPINISVGKMTFHNDANGNDSVNAVFNKLIELRTALDEGDKEATGALLDDFDKLIDNVLSERAIVGAKINRMEAALSRSAAFSLHLTELLSKAEDTDYMEASMAYKTQEAVYEATLATGARVIQPSLLNFLK